MHYWEDICFILSKGRSVGEERFTSTMWVEVVADRSAVTFWGDVLFYHYIFEGLRNLRVSTHAPIRAFATKSHFSRCFASQPGFVGTKLKLFNVS